ncbi:MurT ligase domain-containing protein [Amycolatopsis sp. OK19-0408]|uniref:Lipid II isoglutaminyl synthase (glutamine-hydrolyzing) subunit MurT n=1 Tax=Amycolatopsis iheyensis TaxID=2945988 RepID=A0A9X2NGR8_9PSEU|nr:MurT ligase domain-containing protein [Amycolatopsis iheyensis]MCR6484425.1 MurT ligase domain-containing protein [Amycolatopsis iheyensis]
MSVRSPLRTRASVAAGRATAWLSRSAGLGRGGVIGGRVALALDPRALRRLGQERTVVLVTGTNGKTTTARMLTRALEALAEVAANSDGANMPDGVLAALAASPEAPYAVLEVDETYLPWVAEQLTPAVLVLLNLSRDQLDRVGEVRATERELRAAIASHPETTIVANCDDVLVTSAATGAKRPVWVAAGRRWTGDSTACPRCDGLVETAKDHWRCACGLARPEPTWILDGDLVRTPGGRHVDLDLRLPGDANRANAALALAAAHRVGVPPHTAAARLRTITDIGGRYRTIRRSRHHVRLMLAKNPAGWVETLRVLDEDTPVVVAVNAQEADGRDLSWLWDVHFERLRGRQVVVAGERGADLAVRLCYAEVAHWAEPDPVAAIDALPPGGVELVANYTAFRELVGRLPGG